MLRKISLLVIAAALVAFTAVADWDIGDGYKMHFPQTPDEAGWDVKSGQGVELADDWLCTGPGPVDEIHFWGSWKNMDGDPVTDEVGQIQFFQFAIYSNLPVGHPQNPFPYSIPGTLLWFMEEWLASL